MSVIVRGMSMPSECRTCLMLDFGSTTGDTWCGIADIILAKNFKTIPFDGRPDWCPLVEIPERHGDLIDRTALLKEFELAQKSATMHGREFANAFYSSGNEISTEWWAVEELVENAIAVIAAEEVSE